MFSLFDFLKKAALRNRRRVPLGRWGAVLASVFVFFLVTWQLPLQVFADEQYNIMDPLEGISTLSVSDWSTNVTGWTYSNWLPDDYDISSVYRSFKYTPGGIGSYTDPSGVFDILCNYSALASFSVNNLDNYDGTRSVYLPVSITVSGGFKIESLYVYYDGQIYNFSYRSRSLSDDVYTYVYDILIPNVNGSYVTPFTIEYKMTKKEYKHLTFADYATASFIPDVNVGLSGYFKAEIAISSFNTSMTIISQDYTDSNNSVSEKIDNVNNSIQEGISQEKKFHDEEIDAGNQSGSDAEGLVSSLDTVKSKWEILWYPITFTNNLYAAVTGGGAAYSARSGGIIGYEYDNDVGELIPVYSRTRDAPATSGTVLTFPAFTLPVLNVQVWDSYSFDLASVKDSFPMIFDAVYVIFTVLEVIWFVKFLQKKFHEVFG